MCAKKVPSSKKHQILILVVVRKKDRCLERHLFLSKKQFFFSKRPKKDTQTASQVRIYIYIVYICVCIYIYTSVCICIYTHTYVFICRCPRSTASGVSMLICILSFGDAGEVGRSGSTSSSTGSTTRGNRLHVAGVWVTAWTRKRCFQKKKETTNRRATQKKTGIHPFHDFGQMRVQVSLLFNALQGSHKQDGEFTHSIILGNSPCLREFRGSR